MVSPLADTLPARPCLQQRLLGKLFQRSLAWEAAITPHHNVCLHWKASPALPLCKLPPSGRMCANICCCMSQVVGFKRRSSASCAQTLRRRHKLKAQGMVVTARDRAEPWDVIAHCFAHLCSGAAGGPGNDQVWALVLSSALGFLWDPRKDTMARGIINSHRFSRK